MKKAIAVLGLLAILATPSFAQTTYQGQGTTHRQNAPGATQRQMAPGAQKSTQAHTRKTTRTYKKGAATGAAAGTYRKKTTTRYRHGKRTGAAGAVRGYW